MFAALAAIIIAAVLKGIGRIAFALAAGVLCGICRFPWQNADLLQAQYYYGQNVVISGTVATAPETKEKDLRVVIEAISFNYSTTALKSQVYLMIPASQTVVIGRSDRITVRGGFQEGFGNYAGFLYRPELISVQKPRPPDWSWQIREWFGETIHARLARDEAGLALGYLYGDKASLSDELNEEIRTVGLSHLIVTSGFHLGLIVSFARKVFGKISRHFSLFGSFVLILGFIAITGFSASMARAGIMSMITLSAWLVGRKLHPARSIFYAAAIMVFVRPDFLTNLGSLLSFSAYSGIIFVVPLLNKYFYGSAPVSKIAVAFFPSIAAQLICLPLNIYYFGRIPITGILASMIISPLIAPTMLLTVLAAFSPFCASATQLFLSLHLKIIHFFAGIPWGSVETDAGNLQAFLLYLPIVAVLLYLFWCTGHRYRPRFSPLEKSPDYGKI